MMAQLSFGELLQQFRKNWLLTIPDFCQRAGISHATYTRLVSGQSSVSIDEMRKILALLGITQEELLPVLNKEALAVLDVAEQVDQILPLDGAPVSDFDACSKLKQLCDTQFQHSQNPGFEQLSRLLALFDPQLPRPLAKKGAQKLMAELAAYACWSGFEVHLFIHLAAFLDFDQVTGVFAQYLSNHMRRAKAKVVLDPTLAPGLEVSPYFQRLSEVYLTAALRSGQQGNLVCAADWVTQQKLPTLPLSLRVVQTAAGFLVQQFKDPRQSAEDFLALQKRLKRFDMADSPLSEFIQRLQQKASSVSLKKGTMRHFRPAKTLTTADSILTFRKAKKIRMDALEKAAGVSYATYHRLEQGDGRVGFDVLLAVASYLRINLNDLRFFDTVATHQVRKEINDNAQQVMAGQKQVSAMKDLADDIGRRYQANQYPCFEMERLLTMGMYTQLIGDQKAYHQSCLDIVADISQYPHWSVVMLDSAGALEVAPFARVKMMLTRYLRDYDPQTSAGIPLNLGMVLLESAVHSGKMANLLWVKQYWQTHLRQLRSIEMAALRQLVGAAVTLAQGQTDKAKAQGGQLLADLKAFWDNPVNLTLSSFQMSWQTTMQELAQKPLS